MAVHASYSTYRSNEVGLHRTCVSASKWLPARTADYLQAIGFGANNRLEWNGTVKSREATAVPDGQRKQVNVCNLPMTDDRFRSENGAVQ